MRSKNWKLARACASPALRRLCLISMMTIDRPETAAEFFARRSNGRAVGDLDRILDKVPDRPPEHGDELNAGRPIAYRSEEHTSELQSLMRLSYAVFCLKKTHHTTEPITHN